MSLRIFLPLAFLQTPQDRSLRNALRNVEGNLRKPRTRSSEHTSDDSVFGQAFLCAGINVTASRNACDEQMALHIQVNRRPTMGRIIILRIVEAEYTSLAADTRRY